MANVQHIIPGLEDPTCGIAVAAKQLIARGVGNEDEIWVHSMWTPLVIKASLKALLAGKRLVRMPHGCVDPAKLRHHWHKKRWIAPIERWLFRHADRIVATCEDEIGWIKSFEPKVKRIDLVKLSVPTEILGRPCCLASKPSATSEHSELRLLYVGRLHPLKGVEYLLDAMPQEARLVVIGKDDGAGSRLKAIVSRRNLDVEFRGIVSEEVKMAAYDWCDVLVLPTLSENFGLVIAEALEHGKRVITTDGAPAWGDGNTYGGRLIYLRGYRDGTPEQRVALLKSALDGLAHG